MRCSTHEHSMPYTAGMIHSLYSWCRNNMVGVRMVKQGHHQATLHLLLQVRVPQRPADCTHLTEGGAAWNCAVPEHLRASWGRGGAGSGGVKGRQQALGAGTTPHR